MPCVAYVLNLTIQNGLKQLNIELASSEEEVANEILNGSEDLGTPSCVAPLGKLLIRLCKLITTIKMSLQKIKQYQNMCQDRCVPNNNKLKVDYLTRQNSTFKMLLSAIAKKLVYLK